MNIHDSLENQGEMNSSVSENHLFPVFLQLENLRLLIIGGGFVGFEKLNAVLNNAPNTAITIISKSFTNEISTLAAAYPKVNLITKEYEASDLSFADIVIAAVNEKTLSTQISSDCKKIGKLVNVADQPELCDFYLSSIVAKGNLKIAISTNGKSPTIAKRIKEVLNDLLPNEIDNVLNNLQQIRKQIGGDFSEKVKQLNELTSVLVAKKVNLKDPFPLKPKGITWQKIVKGCLFAFFFMLVGHAFFSFLPFHSILNTLRSIPQYIDTRSFLIMLLTGFLAQMVDGSMGMGYGTISTTFLLANGVSPAIVSSRVHSARTFSSGVSGFSHHRFGNVNMKLFKALVIPGIVGAVGGASLAFIGQKYAFYVRLPLSIYTFYLGYFIIKKALRKKQTQQKVKRVGWLAGIGGFLDAFAGGGWGALVTSTLIAKRKNARYVIGSVCLAEFFVVFASAVTFFILLKHIALADVAGLILGGLIAAPIAARLIGKLPLKTMYYFIGGLVIITSSITFYKAFIQLL
jgi:siroheme synthase-like protein